MQQGPNETENWPKVLARFGVLQITGEFGVLDACAPAPMARHLHSRGESDREEAHVPCGEADKSLGLTVAFEKSICRNGLADGPHFKALSGSVSVFCNWDSGVRWVGFHNKYLMPGGVGLNPDDISVSGPLRQCTEAKPTIWCGCEAGSALRIWKYRSPVDSRPAPIPQSML